MNIENIIKKTTSEALLEIYKESIEPEFVQVQKTKKDFDGDFTIVVFPLLRYSQKTAEETAKELGNYLRNKIDLISGYNAIKGFLNIKLNDAYWLTFIDSMRENRNYGVDFKINSPRNIVIEYSSPNTNKPLHLGHIRNILLGNSVANILQACGNRVNRVNLVNDRGIHICKTMLAWQKWGENKTPADLGQKGDHFVGEFYVKFENEYKQEVDKLVKEEGISIAEARKNSELIQEAQRLLRKWERQNKKVREIWKMMNSWVLDGFNETYNKLNIRFDKIYFESDTYILGKTIVLHALKKGLVSINDHDTIYIDLRDENLDEKVLLRSDGTAVYITQDIGTAVQRYIDFHFDKHIYVVGNEQDYHFQVLKTILERLGYSWSSRIEHFSYGMVELPEGRMKSREGKVVDADDLLEEMFKTAEEKTKELGKLDNIEAEERNDIIRKIGLGALIYFILKVDPKKTMIFNPEESIDFTGNTGPFIQYTCTRINSLLKKAEEQKIAILPIDPSSKSTAKEIQLAKLIYTYPETVIEAGKQNSPALIANYVYDLTKEYNQFYHDYQILKETDEKIRNLRLVMSVVTMNILRSGLGLLGIEVPERM